MDSTNNPFLQRPALSERRPTPIPEDTFTSTWSGRGHTALDLLDVSTYEIITRIVNQCETSPQLLTTSQRKIILLEILAMYWELMENERLLTQRLQTNSGLSRDASILETMLSIWKSSNILLARSLNKILNHIGANSATSTLRMN